MGGRQVPHARTEIMASQPAARPVSRSFGNASRRLPSVPRGTFVPPASHLQSRGALKSSKCPEMTRILCLGMSALDAIYRVPAIPATPTKVLASGFIECGGGMAANARVAVARLGGQVSYWGRLGTDDRGTRILRELADEGVDV